jgi:hypothetical protein
LNVPDDAALRLAVLLSPVGESTAQRSCASTA